MKGKRNEADFQRDKEYLKALKQQENDGELKLYYFDESGFSTTSCVSYVWQRIGETRKIPCCRSKCMNMLGFLNRSNDLFFHTSEQSVTTDTVVNAFDAFVETYAGKYDETKVPCFVVLDNTSIYRSGVFKEKLAGCQQRGVCLHFLPPYSPECVF
ncbi:MAG: transposase [Methylobacter sp.]|nr:transposase [Candidatus Methylobacter titanis]